jgi:hypothetical protein
MKKVIAFAVAVFAAGSVFAGSLDITNPGQTTDTAKYNKLLRVYNADTVAHENGDVVVWQYDAVYGLEITTTTSANNPLVAGVVYPDTIAAGGWGTIMVYGYHPAVTIGVANASGDVLVTSTTGEATGVFNVATTTMAYPVGIALEATTSSTTVKAFIRCQ